ncbi:putative ribosome production factor 2 [Paratrimastix pyriformis]|uniref:Ribosome production factor 2 homolog n=1 Tax=Paratrimastix pyriformis TaxID=342808 RepID=A0ABQ8UQP0_9EUKA|nr:putative ribosome production factor 2 [Paratrimastix pyriformis]
METATDSVVNELSAQLRQSKTKRGRRALETRLPKLVETYKQAMIIKGAKTSEIITELLKDINYLKSPHVIRFSRHNNVLPFDVAGRESLEFFAKKNDCSLMAFGYHQKKRPHSIVFARFFAYQLLHMIELGITGYVPICCFDTPPHAPGSKPCFVFQGDLFETDEVLGVLKNLFLDFFRAAQVPAVNISGLDHVIMVTAVSPKKVLFRHYTIQMKRATGAAAPAPDQAAPAEGAAPSIPTPVGSTGMKVELKEMGPSIDFEVRRHQFADPALTKLAMHTKKPKAKDADIKKNLSRGLLGEELGRVHVGRQDLDELKTHVKMSKALRNVKAPAGAAPAEGEEAAEGEEGPAPMEREGEGEEAPSGEEAEEEESGPEGEEDGEGEGEEDDDDDDDVDEIIAEGITLAHPEGEGEEAEGDDDEEEEDGDAEEDE